jgi:CIC family chloride channel protein
MGLLTRIVARLAPEQPSPKGRRRKLRAMAHRTGEAVILAGLVGAATGLVVAVIDSVIVNLEGWVVDLPLWAAAAMPAVGLALTAAILRWPGGGASASTADEYLQAFHDPSHHLSARSYVARVAATVTTIGTGSPMGLEGVSMYSGTTIGSWVRSVTGRLAGVSERRVLLVAGAAAGVAAIFKAPATGAVFALEVPYQDEFARHMLVPALVGSATGYLAFATIHGTEALLPVEGAPPFNYLDLLAALALGLLAGIGARCFARGLRWAKRCAPTTSIWLRVLVAGVVLAGLVVVSELATGEPLALGPGYAAIEWALDPSRALWAVAVLLVVRCVGTTSVVGGGGVGGLFVPLVVAGALLGRLVGGAIHHLETSLYTVIGVAAFLGAGYRVPLAGVMFVAEATGRPGFVVPGLLAAVAAELVMGTASVTAYQRGAGVPPPAADEVPT